MKIILPVKIHIYPFAMINMWQLNLKNIIRFCNYKFYINNVNRGKKIISKTFFEYTCERRDIQQFAANIC